MRPGNAARQVVIALAEMYPGEPFVVSVLTPPNEH